MRVAIRRSRSIRTTSSVPGESNSPTIAEALRQCGIFIVTVPTPIDQANRPDLKPLILATETVGKALREGGVVIYEFTVYPGCTREVCVPILEKLSGLKLNEGFFVGYSPERANPGDREHG